MRRYQLPATTLGLLLTATAIIALPADVGRTADVFTNAVRYFEARASQPNTWPSPQERPADLAASVPLDDSVAPEEGVLLTADAGDTVLGGQDAVASVVDVVTQSPQVTNVAFAAETEAQMIALETQLSRGLTRAIDDAVAQELVLAVSSDRPDPFAIALNAGMTRAFDAATAAELVLAVSTDQPDPFAIALNAGLTRAVGDAQEAELIAATVAPSPFAFAVALEDGLRRAVSDAEAADLAAATATDAPFAMAAALDDGLRRAVATQIAGETVALATVTVLAPVETFATDAVTLVAAPITDVAEPAAGSSRQSLSPDADVVAVAAGVAEAVDADESGDLMSEMADADENLIIRDGGEEGPDTMMMSSDVLFAFGSATLADDALATLASIGEMSGDVPVLEVFGHTDAIGSESNNLALGQARAEAVRDWLLENTPFAEDQVIATGIGEVDPVAPNLLANGDDDAVGRAQNRRVEFAFHAAGYTPAN